MLRAILAMLVMSTVFASCNGNGDKKDVKAEDTVFTAEELAKKVNVEDVLKNAPQLVKSGDTIIVEGVVDHLCKHGGKKAFIAGTQKGIIRCESTAAMGGKFAQNTLNQPIIVKGVLKEDRINEAVVKQMEESYAEQLKKQEAEHGEDVEVGCETERKAAGQADLDKFADRMADHRAKIAHSDLKDENGEPYYVQSYYILTTTYVVPEK